MKQVMIAAAAIAALTSVAQADGWTGAYGGASFGSHDLSLSIPRLSLDMGSDTAFGVFGGYQHQVGRTVVGGEVSFDSASGIDVVRLRARLGYDADKFMPYATVGLANVEFGRVSDTGITAGLGIDVQVADNVVVGAEFSRLSLDDAFEIQGLDADVNSFQMRTAFKF